MEFSEIGNDIRQKYILVTIGFVDRLIHVVPRLFATRWYKNDTRLVLSSKCKETIDASSLFVSWSLKAYDTNSASRLFEYCGESGTDGAHILSVANGCILEAQRGRAKINVWPLNRYNYDTKARIFAPGKINGFASMSTQKVLAYSVKDTIYFYQSESGQIEVINTCHYLAVNVIKFSSDDCFVACGGEDGMVSLWNVGEILRPGGNKEPLHKFAHHLLPVTDIGFTALARRLRVVTVSEDRTVKVYDVISGTMLSVIFETGLQCVALPSTDVSMVIGKANGIITEIPYARIAEMRECHVIDIIRPSDHFVGHSESITCLAVTNDAMYLVSGSKDATVRVWDTSTHLCLHLLSERGPINSIVVMNLPKNVFRFNYKPDYYFHQIGYSDDSRETFIEINVASQSLVEDSINKLYQEDFLDQKNEVKPEDLLKDINKKLYDFSLQKLASKMFSTKRKLH